MKYIMIMFGLMGIGFAFLGIAGRYLRADTVTLMNTTYAASKFLLVANTFLLIGIFVGVASLQFKKS